MFHDFGFFLFCSATSAWFVVSPAKAFSAAQSRHEFWNYFCEKLVP